MAGERKPRKPRAPGVMKKAAETRRQRGTHRGGFMDWTPEQRAAFNRELAQRRKTAPRKPGQRPRNSLADRTPEQRAADRKKAEQTKRERGVFGGIMDWTPEQRKAGRKRSAATYSDRAPLRRFGRLFADAVNAIESGIDPVQQQREHERELKRERDKRHREKHSAERAEYNRKRRERIKRERAAGSMQLPKLRYPFFKAPPWERGGKS